MESRRGALDAAVVALAAAVIALAALATALATAPEVAAAGAGAVSDAAKFCKTP